jgi:hypothetical protein
MLRARHLLVKKGVSTRRRRERAIWLQISGCVVQEQQWQETLMAGPVVQREGEEKAAPGKFEGFMRVRLGCPKDSVERKWQEHRIAHAAMERQDHSDMSHQHRGVQTLIDLKDRCETKHAKRKACCMFQSLTVSGARKSRM